MIDLKKILNDYKRKGCELHDPKQIRQGKEATVFLVTHQMQTRALKIYVDPKTRSFKKKTEYIEGRFFNKSSERKAVIKGNKFARDLLHRSWVRREFYLLDKLSKAGVTVPKVYEWTPESILMDYIGDEIVAPRLVDIELNITQAKSALEFVLKDIEKFLEFGIVHGDLSAYNILWFKEKPWIIDFPQAIDIRQNQHKEKLIKRDLDNIIHYFSRYFEINIDEIFQRLESQK